MRRRWTVLPPLGLFGVGTELVESLEHYLQRLAWFCGTNPLTIIGRSGNISHTAICGPGVAFMGEVDRLVRLTGRSELQCGTLRALGRLSGWGVAGWPRRDKKWCPLCFGEWDERDSYEHLAWQMPNVVVCPVHGCALERRCASCGAAQVQGRSYRNRRSCIKCGESLAGAGRGTAQSRYSLWAQHQSMMLVKWCANPLSKVSTPSACDTFVRLVCSNMADDSSVPFATKIAVERLVGCDNHRSCDLDTLLNLCSLQGVDAVDVLADPVGAASKPFAFYRDTFELQDLSCQSDREKLVAFESILLALLSARMCALPSPSALAEAMGLSWQHVRRHGSSCVSAYRKRSERLRLYADGRTVDGYFKKFVRHLRETGVGPGHPVDLTWVAETVPYGSVSYGARKELARCFLAIFRML